MGPFIGPTYYNLISATSKVVYIDIGRLLSGHLPVRDVTSDCSNTLCVLCAFYNKRRKRQAHYKE